MKPAKIYQQYIWIVNTLRQYKKLSLEELNKLWMKDQVIGGRPLVRQTFAKHKDAILNMFGVIIECDLEDKYRYYIANPEVLENDSLECNSHGDRYLGMTAAMTQAPVPTAIPT